MVIERELTPVLQQIADARARERVSAAAGGSPMFSALNDWLVGLPTNEAIAALIGMSVALSLPTPSVAWASARLG